METPYVDYSEFYKKLENQDESFLSLDPLETVSPLEVPVSKPNKETKESNPILSQVDNPIIFSKPKSENTQTLDKKTNKDKDKKPNLRTQITEYINSLDIDKPYKNYLIRLAQRESNFNPSVVNKQGYKGLFQLGDSALKDIGMTTNDYMSNWKNQVDAVIKYTDKNRSRLSTLISSNLNRNWNGTPISEYGILGAAHLGGATGLTELLLKGIDKKDANQTSISDYLTYFSS